MQRCIYEAALLYCQYGDNCCEPRRVLYARQVYLPFAPCEVQRVLFGDAILLIKLYVVYRLSPAEMRPARVAVPFIIREMELRRQVLQAVRRCHRREHLEALASHIKLHHAAPPSCLSFRSAALTRATCAGTC